MVAQVARRPLQFRDPPSLCGSACEEEQEEEQEEEEGNLARLSSHPMREKGVR